MYLVFTVSFRQRSQCVIRVKLYTSLSAYGFALILLLAHLSPFGSALDWSLRPNVGRQSLSHLVFRIFYMAVPLFGNLAEGDFFKGF